MLVKCGKERGHKRRATQSKPSVSVSVCTGTAHLNPALSSCLCLDTIRGAFPLTSLNFYEHARLVLFSQTNQLCKRGIYLFSCFPTSTMDVGIIPALFDIFLEAVRGFLGAAHGYPVMRAVALFFAIVVCILLTFFIIMGLIWLLIHMIPNLIELLTSKLTQAVISFVTGVFGGLTHGISGFLHSTAHELSETFLNDAVSRVSDAVIAGFTISASLLATMYVGLVGVNPLDREPAVPSPFRAASPRHKRGRGSDIPASRDRAVSKPTQPELTESTNDRDRNFSFEAQKHLILSSV